MTPHYPQRAPIDAFGGGGFRFAHLSHRGSLLVIPSGMYSWTPSALARLVPDDFSQLAAERAEFDWLLLGTGDIMARPPAPVAKFFESSGLPAEFMSTAAAVRTYNVVLAEGRRVAAAFLAVGSANAG